MIQPKSKRNFTAEVAEERRRKLTTRATQAHSPAYACDFSRKNYWRWEPLVSPTKWLHGHRNFTLRAFTRAACRSPGYVPGKRAPYGNSPPDAGETAHFSPMATRCWLPRMNIAPWLIAGEE